MVAFTTFAERWWADIVVSFGCIVCRNLGWGDTPGIYHHIREGQGAAQRAGNGLGICLCPPHHTDGGHGVAFHAGQRAFEGLYGTELDLLNQTVLEVAEKVRLCHCH